MMATLRSAYLTGGADAWEAAANLLQAGAPAEQVARMARENAAELRRMAEPEHAERAGQED